MLIALGIILFVLLVVVHEFGHFIVAKKSGVEVEEFGVGFPPRAKIITKKNGTEYTLNWLPIGGFVKLKGEHDSATEKGSFGAARFRQKVGIIAAGVIMNWLAAIVIFTALSLVGMPQIIKNQFSIKSDVKVAKQEVFAGSVADDSPAKSIGVSQGDRIISVNDTKIDSAQQLQELTKDNAGKTVKVAYRSEGVTFTKTTKLRDDPKKGNFGVSLAEQTLLRSTWSAPIVGVGTTAQFTVETVKGIFGAVGNLFSGQGQKASESVTGPVGIVVILKDLANQGFVFVLFLIGVISVSLAVMNMLPIPALDGGRLFVMLLYRLMRKPLTKETEEKIHGTGMVALLALGLIITIVDIKRFF
ncbi:site-2 protease family protein [Candidatus Nomurabacteria bacterium]|nr:site-2 protease family protein [Candidatus Nomurabacteria bacterium]